MAFNGDGPHSKRQRTDTESANNRGFNTSSEEPRRKRADESKPNHILLFTIINPMYPITVDVLHTICQSSGQVLRIVIFKKNGVQAMVEFDSVESAVRAKEALSGADIYSGCCTLKIDFAKPEKLNVHKNDSESWDYTAVNLLKENTNGRPQPLLQEPHYGARPQPYKEEVKKRWRGLRDTFRKEFMKQMKNKTGSGADACQPPSWPFFSQLSFLIDTIKPRRMESSVPSVELDDTSVVSDEGSANNDLGEELADRGHADLPSTSQTSMPTSGSHCEKVDSHQQTPTTSSAKKLFKSPPKKKRCSKNELSNFDEKLLELETKKVKYLEQKTTHTQDGDYQFLMSLLPYFHDIPKERKLFVRQKMMGVLIEEFQQQDSATSTPSTPNYSSDDSSSVHYQSLSAANTSSYFHDFDPTVM